MDKTLAWLWLADAVGSGCQYAQELLTLYPDPAELYDALRAGTEAPPACLTPHALAQLRDTTPFDYEERLDHCLLSGIDVLTPDEGVYPDRLRELPDLPLVLYVTGDIACLNGRILTVKCQTTPPRRSRQEWRVGGPPCSAGQIASHRTFRVDRDERRADPA